MRVRPSLILLSVAAAALLTVAGCGADETPAVGASGGGPTKLTVATTVAPITSIVSNIVGDRATVVGIVPEGTNSHTFEPKPSIAELFTKADVVYVNGLQLEEPTKDLAEENLKDGAEVVEIGTLSIPEDQYIYDFSFPKDEGKPNPHLWTDPKYAVSYARIVAEDMSKRDPANASYYADNLARFEAKVGEFDKAMRTSFATLSPAQRTLLTYHDAYAYFAQDYDWKVIGAIQVSDFEDPTAKEVGALVSQVRDTKVPAIFGSEVFPSPVLEQIGRETGVKYVDVLRDDDLPGAPGDPDHSWMGLMRFDYITMTRSLGGDPSALEAFQAGDVAPDMADYPQ